MVDDPSAFVGSVPAVYEADLGPVIFEPLAAELAARLPGDARRIVEVAAGTGRLTRALCARMAGDAHLVATDLNEAMPAIGKAAVPDPRVSWRVADAQALPLAAGEADAACCQLGLMFFPDKPRALRELRRVLRPGGTLLVNVMGPIAESPWTVATQQVVEEMFPGDPPLFYLVPFSLGDRDALAALVAGAGFAVTIDTIRRESTSPSAVAFARGLIRGNPISQQIVARGGDLAALEAGVAARLAERFGDHPLRIQLVAHVVTAVA